jgi:hypothetical protein
VQKAYDRMAVLRPAIEEIQRRVLLQHTSSALIWHR